MLLDEVRHPNIAFGRNLQSSLKSLYDAEYRAKYRVRQNAIDKAKEDITKLNTSIKVLYHIMKVNASEFDLTEVKPMKSPKTVKEWKDRVHQIIEIIDQEAIGLPEEFDEDERKYNIDAIARANRAAHDKNGKYKGQVLDNKGFTIKHFNGLSDKEKERINDIAATFGVYAHFVNLDNFHTYGRYQ